MRRSDLDPTGAGILRDGNGHGLDSMVAVGNPPWHYAQSADMIRLRERSSKITSKEINEQAGLAWTVYQAPAYLFVGSQQPTLDENGFLADDSPAKRDCGFKLVGTSREQGKAPVPDYYLNVRDDIHRVIGIVKRRYRVFQNVEAPVFLDNLVDSGEAQYETAGSLFGGSQVWWLMKLPEGVSVGGDPREKLETYLLLTNSHDGSTSIVVAAVTVRVVCQNTLAWSLENALRTMKIRHTNSAKEQFMEARRTLQLGFTYQHELLTIGDRMIQTSISDEEFAVFLDSLVPTPAPIVRDNKVSNQRGITIALNTKAQISELYYHHPTQAHAAGTLWGVVQAVQFFSDHLATSRTTDDATAEENRFRRLTSGATLGSTAFSRALSRVAV